MINADKQKRMPKECAYLEDLEIEIDHKKLGKQARRMKDWVNAATGNFNSLCNLMQKVRIDKRMSEILVSIMHE